jgi:hypothetical protein
MNQRDEAFSTHMDMKKDKANKQLGRYTMKSGGKRGASLQANTNQKPKNSKK